MPVFLLFTADFSVGWHFVRKFRNFDTYKRAEWGGGEARQIVTSCGDDNVSISSASPDREKTGNFTLNYRNCTSTDTEKKNIVHKRWFLPSFGKGQKTAVLQRIANCKKKLILSLFYNNKNFCWFLLRLSVSLCRFSCAIIKQFFPHFFHFMHLQSCNRWRAWPQATILSIVIKVSRYTVEARCKHCRLSCGEMRWMSKRQNSDNDHDGWIRVWATEWRWGEMRQ